MLDELQIVVLMRARFRFAWRVLDEAGEVVLRRQEKTVSQARQAAAKALSILRAASSQSSNRANVGC
jgi:hypothetical protein